MAFTLNMSHPIHQKSTRSLQLLYYPSKSGYNHYCAKPVGPSIWGFLDRKVMTYADDQLTHGSCFSQMGPSDCPSYSTACLSLRRGGELKYVGDMMVVRDRHAG